MAPNASAISSLAVTSHTVSFDHGYGAWILIVMGAGRRWTLKCDDSAAANLWSDAIGTAINNSASTSSIFRAAAAPVRAATINNSSPTRENYAGSPTASSASTDADTSPRNQFARALNAQANTATRPPAITLAAPAAAPRRAPTAGTAEAGLFSSSNGRLQTAPTDAYALSAASTPPPPPPSANGRLQEWMTPAGTRSPPALAAAPAHAYADAFMSANGRLQHWPSSDSLSSSRGTTATAASPPMTRRDNHSNAGTPEYQAPGGGVSPLARTPSLRSRERPPRVVAGLDMLRTGSNRSAHSPFYGPDTDQSQQDTRAWR
ncbi:hypothetical protein HDU83_005349 [Entophlyctis luteolus]|nr:hypothetical protein HDU83_005349 [Entophlyctis luteolus]